MFPLERGVPTPVALKTLYVTEGVVVFQHQPCRDAGVGLARTVSGRLAGVWNALTPRA